LLLHVQQVIVVGGHSLEKRIGTGEGRLVFEALEGIDDGHDHRQRGDQTGRHHRQRQLQANRHRSRIL
jgi:hypothetical protein